MGDPRPERHFLIVRTVETIKGDRASEFSLQGFDRANGEAYPLEQGDKLAVYVGRPVSGFVATSEVVGPRYISDERVWTLSDDPHEVYPVRYPTKPRVVVENDRAVPFKELIDLLEYSRYLRNRDRWGMLFIKAIRQLTADDFGVIEDWLRASAIGRRIA